MKKFNKDVCEQCGKCEYYWQNDVLGCYECEGDEEEACDEFVLSRKFEQ